MTWNFGMIGEGCLVATDSEIQKPEKIFLGNNVVIERGVRLDATYGRGIRIGDNVTIKQFASVVCSGTGFDNGYVLIGSSSHIGSFNILTGHGGLSIGSDVLLGPYVSVNGYAHNFEDPDTLIRLQGGRAIQIDIGNDVYVATRASILTGPIGTGSVIAAHSLVTKAVPPYSIVKGQPAKVARSRKNSNAGNPLDQD